MTSTRIVSGVVFFALLLLGLFQPTFYWLPPLMILGATLTGVWEFSHLGVKHPPRVQLFFSLLAAAALLADAWFFSLGHAVLILGLLIVFTVAAGLPLTADDIAAVSGKSAAGPLYVGLPFALILVLWRHNLDPSSEFPNAGAHYILFLIFVTWSSDTGAYFAGRQFGKRKIFPNLSPGKTLEGYIGGMVFTLALALALKLFWNNIDALFTWFDVAILAGAFGVISPLGDLAESRLKRAAHAKDSGQTFTGHGGMLDIIDSLLFTTIFYILYLVVLYPSAFPTAR